MDQRKSKFIGKRWPAFALGLVISLVLSLTTAALVRVELERQERIEQADTRTVENCQRQHALIEMQRLFLREHAAIRLQLEDAGIPDRHAVPGLLDELGQLIEEADCIVGEDVGGS